ncbi:hypothetical protein [Shewanella gelidii]|uniref:Uncharacterized protein n=1 Tax=Shewanella gelidii TaxID=1642821 RepID=A0A917JKA1_9GAMM|nr:hypothetical protein [Shewanella gelidii]MCL1097119.1 hypothetical protein [Shewanella gelidii]GGI72682.1 hypothetical protein GCM10009332_07650 [Shewanella gelidii]
MEKHQYQFSTRAEPPALKKLSIAAAIIGCGLVISESFIGNSYTHMVVMLYLCFLLPAVALTKAVRIKFFYYIQDYIVVVRSFAALMCIVFLAIWVFSIISYQNQSIPF